MWVELTAERPLQSSLSQQHNSDLPSCPHTESESFNMHDGQFTLDVKVNKNAKIDIQSCVVTNNIFKEMPRIQFQGHL